MAGLPPGLSAQYWSRLAVAGPGVEGLGLSDGEAWIGGWDGVGLYEGNSKVGTYQSLTFHLTTHRLLLVPDSASPQAIPLQAPLSSVRQTEFYTGFMRSSPKITLYLGRGPVVKTSGLPDLLEPDTGRESPAEVGNWTCGVCGFANPLPAGTTLGPDTKCALCGVGWSVGRTLTPAASSAPSETSRTGTPVSSSLAPTPARASTPAAKEEPSSKKQISCPACTFLNHPSMSQCEICGTPLRRRTASTANGGGTTTSGESSEGAGGGEKHDVVRLSFRKGGAADAYKKLKGVLSDRVWERSVSAPVRDGDKSMGGIDAIMRNITLSARQADGHVQSAFRDLEVMMVRAGEMVSLAQSLEAKLAAAGHGTEEEETLVRSSLVRMGLPAPALTSDMVKDERAYLDGLARELGALLTGTGGAKKGGLMLEPGHGVLALDTVWGVWMRMRGLALLPPSTLTLLLDLLPLHTRPVIRKMQLPSGLLVLYAPNYDPEAWRRRLIHRLREEPPPSNVDGLDGEQDGAENGAEGRTEVVPGLSPLEICALEGVPLGLGEELTELAARRGGIVRDDQARGGRWYADLISEWPLGQLA